MKVTDMNSTGERHLKALVYGPSGTGKTSFGVTAPSPLILLSEAQAKPHIRAAAERMGRPMPTVLEMETLDDYRHVIVALRADRAKPFLVRNAAGATVFTSETWPETIVIDSITDAMELVSEEIRTQSPPKMGKDGLPVDSERYWNVLADRAGKLIRAFRDLPFNVLYLCLQDDRTVEQGDGTKTKWVGPQVPMRKLPGVIMAAVNVVGVTYRARAKTPDKDGNRLYEYGIRTVGPDYVQLKPFPPLREYEVTDFTSWCNRIHGIDDGSKSPAPMESDEVAPTATLDVGSIEAQPDPLNGQQSKPVQHDPLGPPGQPLTSPVDTDKKSRRAKAEA